MLKRATFLANWMFGTLTDLTSALQPLPDLLVQNKAKLSGLQCKKLIYYTRLHVLI